VQLIVFVAILVALTALVHWYLWLRLIRDTTPPGPARRLGTVLAALLTLLVPVTLIGTRALRPEAARWLAWPGYLWLALVLYLLVGLLLAELPRLAIRLVPARRPAPAGVGSGGPPPIPGRGPPVSRRLVMARSTAALVSTAAVGLVGYGMTSALGPPKITPVTVPLRRLPAGLDGLRMAVVSDIHLGPMRGRAHTERIVRMINEQRADVISIVGDLVDGTVDELGEAAAPLRDLVSTHGSFFVTGNHEYYAGVTPWLRELARLGVRPLANERAEIRAGDAVLDLAGVNDVTAEGNGVKGSGAEGPDYDQALGGRDPNRPVVLLAHQPVQVHEAARRGVDLQLSGHTHGGQMFPLHGLVRLQQPALSGLHRFGDTRLFVTRGAGFWGPPVRVGAPPEIAIVRLTRGQS
jgi:uncharacterized protein